MGGLPPAIWITPVEAPGPGRRLAVKDLFDTAGLRTTYGSAIFRDHVPGRTATAVRLLEQAGYANAGKANLHEFAYGITSHNPHFGDVPNPAAPGRVAGGSSGGCAAALATGAVEAGLGTDSGGSIRIPAACCGVVGFKPTWGLVPIDGCFPLAPSFDHAGPMARDVAGCARMMEALAPGPGPPDMRDDTLAVGVAWTADAEPAVRELAERAAALLPGAIAVELPRPVGVFPAFQREIADVHRELFARQRRLYGRNVAAKIERCIAITDGEDASARVARVRYRELMASAMAAVDVVLTPTLPIVPPPARGDELALRERMTENTFPFNAIGAPALALPCGITGDGLPVSVQLAGPPGADALVLAAGKRLEAALGHTGAREEPTERGA